MVVEQLPQIIPNSSFRKEVEQLGGEKVSACFQCEKCTNGCPVLFAMDITPHKIIHAIQLGMKDEILHSDTIWVCASCETCTTRCPNNIDIAHIMDTLRQMSLREGIKVSQPKIPVFHSAFLSSIKRHGKVSEMEMALSYYLKSEGLTGLLKQAGMGIRMFLKGKMKLLPDQVKDNGKVKDIFNKAGERR